MRWHWESSRLHPETTSLTHLFPCTAAWNAILWCLVLLFLPETKGLSLEELDRVFSVPTKKQAWHGIKEIPYFINKYIFRRDVYLEPLVKTNTLENRPTYAAKRDIQHHEKGEKQV